MNVRKIKFLIDLRIQNLEISSISGSFWSKTAKIDHFDQNDPKLTLIFKISLRESIRNLFFRIDMYLHRYNITIP